MSREDLHDRMVHHGPATARAEWSEAEQDWNATMLLAVFGETPDERRRSVRAAHGLDSDATEGDDGHAPPPRSSKSCRGIWIAPDQGSGSQRRPGMTSTPSSVPTMRVSTMPTNSPHSTTPGRRTRNSSHAGTAAPSGRRRSRMWFPESVT